MLCLTHGEASTLHHHEQDLHATRAEELDRAAHELGVGWVRLLEYPDAGLWHVPLESLRDEALSAIGELSPGLVLLLDENGVTGHKDHVRASLAGLMAAGSAGLDAVAWSLPEDVAHALNREFGASFRGRSAAELGSPLTVDRSRQLRAIAEHRSQSAHNPVLWRRLELQGAHEWLRWAGVPDRSPVEPGAAGRSRGTAVPFS